MEKLILEFFVRSVLVAVATAAALYFLRVRAARVRHAVWAGVVVLMLVLPGLTAWGPKAVLRVMKPEPVAVSVQPVVETMQQDAASTPVPQSAAWTWRNWLAAVYLLGLCGLLARLGIGTVRARMLVLRAGKLEDRLTSDACVAPITVGWLNPAVILPVRWTQWSAAQLDAVLAHEDEHVRRRDPLVQWLALLNRAVFWFHPLAWWLERRLSALAEEACDDAVLTRGHDPVAYSECLLGLARVVQTAGVRVAVVGMAMPGTFLPQRIRRIMAGSPVQRVSRARMIGVVAVCAVVASFFVVGAVGYSVPVGVAQPLSNVRGSVGATGSERVSRSEGVSQAVGASPTFKVVRKKAPVLLAQAQTSSAVAVNSFAGSVVDPSDAVVPNAGVTLLNTDTNTPTTTTTDATGRYRFENISPGTYSVTISAPGFKRETQTGIHVAAGEAHNGGTMLLQLGQVAESVSIVGSRLTPVLPPTPTLFNEPGLSVPPPAPFVEQFWLRRDSAPAPAGAIRVGGNVQAVNLILAVKPYYPVEQQRLGIQGTVAIQAIISKEGVLSDARVVSNIDAGLTQAALDALKKWRYRPTMLNGEPVEVLTTIDFNFSLRD